MKLEVGMYVRTKSGEIGKIRVIIDNMVFINGNQYYSTIEKASHNLLGNDKEPCLIEVGDYVNGLKVIEVREHLHSDVEIVLSNGEFQWSFSKNESDYKIKSIVTKEQFEKMSYKIEREEN